MPRWVRWHVLLCACMQASVRMLACTHADVHVCVRVCHASEAGCMSGWARMCANVHASQPAHSLCTRTLREMLPNARRLLAHVQNVRTITSWAAPPPPRTALAFCSLLECGFKCPACIRSLGFLRPCWPIMYNALVLWVGLGAYAPAKYLQALGHACAACLHGSCSSCSGKLSTCHSTVLCRRSPVERYA